MFRWSWLVVLLIPITGCERFSADRGAFNKTLTIEVIYGEDNRIDYYQETDPLWQDYARSTVALMDQGRLEWNASQNHFDILSLHYGLSKHLCSSEAFFDQGRSAFCSGFLIGPDLVVTAGHCIRNSFNCEDVRFVFDFYQSDFSSAPIKASAEQVYRCQQIIHSQANALTGSDFALIRLDRKVEDRNPLSIRTTGEIQQDSQLTVIGYPSGLPMKIAHQGKVRSLKEPAHFLATLDTYGGNSGSAVFNTDTGLVEGILFNGDTDFVFDQDKKCNVSNACQETSCRGEDVTRISEIFPYITPQDLSL